MTSPALVSYRRGMRIRTCFLVLLAVLAGALASCRSSRHPRAPTAEQVAAALARNPEFVRAVAAAAAPVPTPTSPDSGVAEGNIPSPSLANLHAMAICLSDVSLGSTNQRAVVPARLELCARVGLGTEALVVRQPASAARVAECYEACTSLRRCMAGNFYGGGSRVGERDCMRWNGLVNSRFEYPTISQSCIACREEARTVTQSLGLTEQGEDPSAPTP